MYNPNEVRKTEVIVITSVPHTYGDSFSRTIGKPITATKTGFGGWHVPVAHDVIDNPNSIWTQSEEVTLFFKEGEARPATQQEVNEMLTPLTGGIAKTIGDELEASFRAHMRATSRDNPFRHWNRIKGNRKLGLPEVYAMQELRA